MKNEEKKKKKKKKEIITIHLWGRICRGLHYGDKSFPTYRMGRICKIVGKDSFVFWGRICGEWRRIALTLGFDSFPM